MEKIIRKFIKDFNDLNKRQKYEFDFKNNIILYDRVAMYKADIRLFNYDFLVENDIKMIDLTEHIEEFKNVRGSAEVECLIEYTDNKKSLMLKQFRVLDNLINIDNDLIKLISTKNLMYKGNTCNNPIIFYNKNSNELEAIIMPVKIKR